MRRSAQNVRIALAPRRGLAARMQLLCRHGAAHFLVRGARAELELGEPIGQHAQLAENLAPHEPGPEHAPGRPATLAVPRERGGKLVDGCEAGPADGIVHYRPRPLAQCAHHGERLLVFPVRRIAFDQLAHSLAMDAREPQLVAVRRGGQGMRHAGHLSEAPLPMSSARVPCV